MMALVTGGASSGKSAFAERLAISLPGPHAYLATMRHGDAETEARIERHRRMREGKGFSTVELAGCAPDDASAADAGTAPRAPIARTALLEDLGNLVANELESALDYVLGYENVVVVANEVGSDAGTAPRAPIARTALLEDLGNLVANELESALDYVLGYENVVVVANEVGSDGIAYDDFTLGYIERLGALACELGARADVVVEVVCGVPHVVKGELTCLS